MVNDTTETVYVLFRTLNGHGITVILLLINAAIFVIAFLALALNAVVLDTIVKRTSMDPTDILMCNLAATDMLTGLLILHTVTYNIVYFQNTVECLIRIGASFIFISSSVHHLTLLTLDRFIQIVFPFRYPDIINRRSVTIMSFAVWIFSVNYGLLPSYGWRNTPGPQEPPCSFLGVLPKEYIQFGLAVFFSPVAVIGVLYSKIFIVARRHARAIAATAVAGTTKASGMKFTKTVVILIGTYLISFLPMAMVAMVYTVGGFQGMSAADVGDYIVYTSVLTFANSVVNPIIYAFKLPPVRKRFLRFIGKTGTTTTNRSVNGRGPAVISEID